MEQIKDPGLGYKTKAGANRLINPNGSSNVTHVNSAYGFTDIYTYLINISWGLFFLYVVSSFVVINIIFASIYYFVGIEGISIPYENTTPDFLQAFFFSAQTLTTVGYGALSPLSDSILVISSFEAMAGFLGFAFITGLLYGRFSKPTPSVRFSSTIIVRDFKGHRALMFRLMNTRKSIMIEPNIMATLSISQKDENDNVTKTFYVLELERNKIKYLPTMWTIVHEINAESPLFEYSTEEMKKLKAEVVISFDYYEQSFTQRLYQLRSYCFEDLTLNKKFVPSFSIIEDGSTVLNHNLLDEVEDL